jgi:hypothetical protein
LNRRPLRPELAAMLGVLASAPASSAAGGCRGERLCGPVAVHLAVWQFGHLRREPSCRGGKLTRPVATAAARWTKTFDGKPTVVGAAALPDADSAPRVDPLLANHGQLVGCCRSAGDVSERRSALDRAGRMLLWSELGAQAGCVSPRGWIDGKPTRTAGPLGPRAGSGAAASCLSA